LWSLANRAVLLDSSTAGFFIGLAKSGTALLPQMIARTLPGRKGYFLGHRRILGAFSCQLKSRNTNESDVGGVLQRTRIQIKVCPKGDAGRTAAKRHGALNVVLGEKRLTERTVNVL
jgi:hypothetical protein